ncbi:PepSY-associated TM helix domain-containing protein [Nostoc sp.]|uniref:PepSY-associated TM helix domain-containing protein n=1 Tax=Nostoc sp. TaxID=1180 RepID=UPI002FFBB38C
MHYFAIAPAECRLHHTGTQSCDSQTEVFGRDRVIDSFGNLHFGTFWGLTSQILYVFVGLAPLVLFLTGLMMWRYRYKEKNRQQ